MHISARKLILGGLSFLLIAALICFVLTREGAAPVLSKPAVKTEPAAVKLVDRSPLETAHGLSNVASTAAEQQLAADAVRIADHEVDLAFVTAVQLAQQRPTTESSETKELNARITLLENRLQQVQAQVKQFTKLAASPGKEDAHAIQQQLEIAQARATLLQDALDDAKEDLVRAGGDPQAQIKQELEEHEALEHASTNAAAGSPSKPASFGVAGNLVAQFRAWQRLRNNQTRLLAAKQQAETYAGTLTRKHEALEKGLSNTLGTDDTGSQENETTPATGGDETQHAAKMAKLNRLSQNTKALAQYDKRIQAEKQLADLYGQWNEILNLQRRVALHAILRSLLWILLALIGLVLAEGLIERFYMRLGPDRRRLATMRLVLRFITQLIGMLIILLVLFGPPSQLSTVLALGAAGLTVALKDFIVAFFGWFILMGRHGIRAGDWVEINGVGGEVVEVGLLRTILLETGNWNDAGHPTGRKVSCVNSFAIEGHYFNFTTSGQWLWDELDVLIPAGEDPYYLTNSVLKLVTEETQADATAAEQEWRRAMPRSAIQTFSALPAINVRPTNLGVNLVVRYVVNAHRRYEVRTRLYQAIVELLHGTKLAETGDTPVPADSRQQNRD
jgi:small-conductance mechanosensitive channel